MQPIESALLEKLPKAYPFAGLMAKRRKLAEEGVEVLDLSIGESDLPPPSQAIDALAEAACSGNFQRYPTPRGSEELRVALADFYERRYGAQLDPNRNFLPLLGSKEAIVNLTRAFADDRRPVYVGEVGYPVYRVAAAQAGARTFTLSGGWDEGYVPAFPGSPPAQGGVCFLSSPANPTGSVLDEEALLQLRAACTKHSAILCFDAAYAEMSGKRRPVLPIPLLGAEGVVEFHSCSKALSLAGWRIGFAAGDPRIIDGLARVKSFLDAGMPSPQQLAMARLLYECDDVLDHVRARYASQQAAFRRALSGLPIELFDTDAGMFCWFRVSGRTGEELADACLEEGIVAVPGGIFGNAGSDCLRTTVTLEEEKLPELTRRLERILG